MRRNLDTHKYHTHAAEVGIPLKRQKYRAKSLSSLTSNKEIENYNHRKISFALVVLCAILPLSYCYGQQHDSKTSITTKILKIKAALKSDHQKRSKIEQELEATEINTGKLSIILNNTHNSILQKKRQLKQLSHSMSKITIQLQSQQEAFKQHLRRQYIIGNKPLLKLLLDNKNLAKSERMMTYAHYLNQAYIKSIQQQQQTIQELKKIQKNLQQKNQQLLTTQAQQRRQKQRYQKLNLQRHKLLNTFNASIKTHQQKLAILIKDRKQLETTVTILNQNKPSLANNNSVFAKNQGGYPWPSQGKIKNMYGLTIDNSQLKWQGILIQAPENRPVYAINSGTVIFSKWLSGYGLLLIIQHDHGYMTLYGRLHSIYAAVGAHVKSGAKIATIGNTGGFKESGLYFAIRHNAQPLNPTQWCK